MAAINDSAYAAGIVDGEGSISMTAVTGPKRGKGYWRITVSVSSCDEVLIDWLVDRWQGATLRHMDRGPTRRLQYRWTLVGNGARAFLGDIEPFLVIKRERAQKAVEVLRLQAEPRGGFRSYYSDEQRQRMSDLRAWFDQEKQQRSAAARGNPDGRAAAWAN